MSNFCGNDSYSDIKPIHFQGNENPIIQEIAKLRNENALLKKDIEEIKAVCQEMKKSFAVLINQSNATDMNQSIYIKKEFLSKMSLPIPQGMAAQGGVVLPGQEPKLVCSTVIEARRLVITLLKGEINSSNIDAVFSIVKDFLTKMGAVKHLKTLDRHYLSQCRAARQRLLEVVRTVGCLCVYGGKCNCA